MKFVFFNYDNGFSAVFKLNIVKEDRGYTVTTHKVESNKYTGKVYNDITWTEWINRLSIIDKWLDATKAQYKTCKFELK